MNAEGYVMEVIPNEGVKVFYPFSDTSFIDKREITQVAGRFTDGRAISAIQRNKIHALVGDIAEYVCAPGPTKRRRIEKETLREMQLLFVLDLLHYSDRDRDRELIRRQLTTHFCNLVDIDLFSLSDRAENACDMTTAREFIDWLVELCVIHGIPCQDTLLNRCEDIGRYMYACVANRRCAICGKRAEIHEYDRVGAGRNRRKIHHLGQRVQPLCREHHCEVDRIGQKTFDEKYHLEWVVLDENLCTILKWKK